MATIADKTNGALGMGGLLTMANPGMAENPLYQAFDQRRNTIAGLGAGLMTGDSGLSRMRGVSQGMMQGRMADTAYQVEQQKQQQAQNQLNQTIEAFRRSGRDDLVQAVQGGLPMKDAWGEYLSAQAGGGEPNYFGTPIPFRTEDGIQYGQLNDAGDFKPIALPGGASFAPKTSNVDLGNMVSVQDQFGNELYRMPKSGGVPTGYGAPDQSGAIAPMEGGPQAREIQQAEEAKALKARNADERAAFVINEIDKAIDKSSFTTTGPLGTIGRNVGVPSAVELQTAIDPIVANLGFDELQAMRDSSPTGGALGQVTERELKLLQSVVTSLDPRQGEEQLDDNLRLVRNLLKRNQIYREIDRRGLSLDDPQAQQMLNQYPLPGQGGAGSDLKTKYGLE